MANAKFRLNRRGVSEVLRKMSVAATNSAADQIAQNVRSAIGDDTIDVEVDHYTTDRGAAAVTIADPKGLELQAKGGVLTRAAAAAGLEVKSK